MDYKTIWNKQEGPSDTSAGPGTMSFETVGFKVEPHHDNTGPGVFHEPQAEAVTPPNVPADIGELVRAQVTAALQRADTLDLVVRAITDSVSSAVTEKLQSTVELNKNKVSALQKSLDEANEKLHTLEKQVDTSREVGISEDHPLSIKEEIDLAPEDDDHNASEADAEEESTTYAPGSKRREMSRGHGCKDRDLVEILTMSDSECEFSDGSSDDSSTESPTSSPRPSAGTAHQFQDSTRGAVDSDSYSDSEESETAGETPRKRSRLNDSFEWKQTDFQPIKHEFDGSASGYKCQLVKDSSILSFFTIFMSEDLLQFIADETNRFYLYTKANTPKSLHSRLSKWRDTGFEELYLFVAICLLMAQVKKLKIRDYWSRDILLNTPVFSEIMPRDRFILLLRMLHFSDNSVGTGGDNLFKIRNIVNKVRAAFRSAFSPNQKLSIDESLSLFKDQLFFKRFIQSKNSRFRLKTFVLCDCQAGYILDFVVYTGAAKEIWFHNLGKSGDIVATLMKPYLEKGHTLYVNSRYSSPDLFLWLHNHKTNACGIVHKNTQNMPKLQRKLKRGEIECKATDKMLAIRWCDKKEVFMLTTCHTTQLVETEKTDRSTGEKIERPKCIVDYNSTVAAVDRCDMLLSSIGSAHKTVKWYKRYFFHILDLSILNAHALHRSVTGQRVTLAEFHLSLVREIIEKYATERSKGRRGRHSSDDNPLRFTGRHFPDGIVSEQSKKRTPARRCVVCSKRKVRRETRFRCKTCSVPLCIVPCFEIYHTIKDYQ